MCVFNNNRKNFLSNILREEGGFEYNKAIVNSIVIPSRDIPDAKEGGLLTYVNSSRTVNLHIFLLRLISSILANPGFIVYPHYFFVIFVFI